MASRIQTRAFSASARNVSQILPHHPIHPPRRHRCTAPVHINALTSLQCTRRAAPASDDGIGIGGGIDAGIGHDPHTDYRANEHLLTASPCSSPRSPSSAPPAASASRCPSSSSSTPESRSSPSTTSAAPLVRRLPILLARVLTDHPPRRCRRCLARQHQVDRQGLRGHPQRPGQRPQGR